VLVLGGLHGTAQLVGGIPEGLFKALLFFGCGFFPGGRVLVIDPVGSCFIALVATAAHLWRGGSRRVGGEQYRSDLLIDE
jgi:hypothetical protein